MKKLLLSLLAVAGLSASAAEVTDVLSAASLETMPNYSATSTAYAEYIGVKGESGAEYTLQCAHNKGAYIQLRSANSNSGIVSTKSPGKVVKVVVEWADNTTNKRTLNIYGGGSAFTIAGLYGTNAPKADGTIIKGTSTSFDFTNYPEYIGMRSSDGAMYITKISITWDIADSSKEAAGLKYETTSYNLELGEAFTAPDLINPNGLTVAYSSSKPEVATVNATTGAVEIVGAGTTTITAKSEETATYNAGSASYTITVTAPVETIASVAATKELASETEFKVGYELTVAFKNYSNVFACDAAGDFIQIYGSNSYNIGDKIPAGWTGEYVLYNGNTPEIKPVGNLPEGEAGTFTPAVVSATAISTELVNSVVTINNVELEAATPGEDVTDSNAKNFTGTVDGTTLNFRNNYKLASVEAGTYNITVVVTVYQNEPSLYVTNFEKVTPTGINGIFVEENAPVEYYNLQGVRVANPENGLYIRRQGNKATKVLVK